MRVLHAHWRPSSPGGCLMFWAEVQPDGATPSVLICNHEGEPLTRTVARTLSSVVYSAPAASLPFGFALAGSDDAGESAVCASS